MNRHPARTVPGVRFPVVDNLAMIADDDELLDSIAAGSTDVGDLFGSSAQLGPILANWRAELVEVPMPVLPPLAVAKRVMCRPAPVARRRALRPILAAAVAICALLVGSTAVGAHSAKPGDPLWALTRVLYSEHANSVVASIAVQSSLDDAEAALASNDPQGAIEALNDADLALAKVPSKDGGLLALVQQVHNLRVKVNAENTGGTSGTSRSANGSLLAIIPPGTTETKTTAPTTTSPPPTTTAGSRTSGGVPGGLLAGAGPTTSSVVQPQNPGQTVVTIITTPPGGDPVPVIVTQRPASSNPTVPVTPTATINPPSTDAPTTNSPTPTPVTTSDPPSSTPDTPTTTPDSPTPTTPDSPTPTTSDTPTPTSSDDPSTSVPDSTTSDPATSTDSSTDSSTDASTDMSTTSEIPLSQPSDDTSAQGDTPSATDGTPPATDAVP